MELCHLWIESLNDDNTHHSFNFSGRFNFEIEIKENININVQEKEDYVNKFFAEKIRINCITGKNGTGKSTIINTLISIMEGYNSNCPNYVIIYFNEKENEFLIQHSFYKKSKTEIVFPFQKYVMKETKETNFSSIYDYILGKYKPQCIYYSPFFDIKHKNISEEKGEPIDISTDRLIYEDNYQNINEQNDKISFHKLKNVERIFKFIDKYKSHFKIIKSIPIPNELSFIFNIPKASNPEDNLNWHALQLKKYFLGDNDSIGIFSIHKNPIIDAINLHLRNENVLNDKDYKLKHIELFKLNFLESMIRHFFHIINLADTYYLRKPNIKKNDLEKIESIYDSVLYMLTHINYELKEIELLKSIIEHINTKIDFNNVEFVNQNTSYRRVVFKNDFDTILNLLQKQEEYHNCKNTIVSQLNKGDLFNIEWRDISSGEKALLDLFSRLYYAYNKIQQNYPECETIYLFLDEGEIGFHPEWQRKYISTLNKVLPEIFPEMSIQLILTSHSPFIVSDLPPENIVFLNKINGKTVIEDYKDKKTFGANIHTILADGFFLENGLIGEFAQQKINSIIEQINSTNDLDNPDEIQKIINLIGEPIIKTKLQQMFDKKVGKDYRISLLDKEIKRLQDAKNAIEKS